MSVSFEEMFTKGFDIVRSHLPFGFQVESSEGKTRWPTHSTNPLLQVEWSEYSKDRLQLEAKFPTLLGLEGGSAPPFFLLLQLNGQLQETQVFGCKLYMKVPKRSVIVFVKVSKKSMS